MNTPIRLLMVEDNETDAELAARKLKRSGLDCVIRRVETEAAFRSALSDFHPDVVVSDYRMPVFDGLTALSISRELRPDLPFIFCSGTIGQENAQRALEAGAAD